MAETTSSAPPSSLRAVLRSVSLRRVVAAQTASTTANQVVALVIPWLVLQRTGSALDASTVLFATGLTAVVGTLFGGAVVDRIGARTASVASDVLSALTILVIPVALWRDALPLWLIVVTQIVGVLFDGPGVVARNALLAAGAERDDVPMAAATSFQKTFQGAGTLVGPLVGGSLLAVVDAGPTSILVSVVFVAAVVLALRLPPDLAPAKPDAGEDSILTDLRAGFSYLRHDSLLGPLTLMLGLWAAVYAPLATLVYPTWFIRSGASAGLLGGFLAAQAVGGITGGLFYAAVSERVPKHRWFVTSNLIATALLVGIACTAPGSPLSLAGIFAVGFAGAASMPILNAAYYTRAPADLMGRVTGAGWAVVLAAMPVSSLAMGALISHTSPVTGLGVVVAGNLLVIALFALLPTFRQVDDP